VSPAGAGPVAVVTGAGSGIGRALALELDRRGARLALSDVDETRLAGLVPGAHTARLDVTDRDAVQAYAAEVAGHFGVVNQVYNNAGIAGAGTSVLDSDWAGYDRVLAVNLFGVIAGTRAFLPHLVASGAGHVVNISSLNGIAGQAALSAYCASKFAVRGFSESLRAELLLAGHPVKVTVVHPGGVRTDIAAAALREAARLGVTPTAEQLARARTYEEKLLRMPAAQAARIILDGVAAGKPRVLVGRDAKLVDALVRLLPSHYPALLARADRRLFR
jgi:NAD(P)-dependent dehydrogenase (short-subunit alcohol dehydrogenase family)